MATHAHTTPTPAPGEPPTRRLILSAFTGAAFAGLSVVAAPADAAENADAELLAVCAQIEALQRRINGKWAHGIGAAEYRCENYVDEDDDRLLEDEPLDLEIDALLDKLDEIGKPISLPAMQAVARCILLVDPEIRASATTNRRTMSHNPVQAETLLAWLLGALTGGEITDATCMDAPGFLVVEEAL